MKLNGKLCLSHKGDYLIVAGGRNSNLTEILNEILMDTVSIKVVDTYNNKILFEEEGEFIKDRIDKGFYLYHVDGQDLDTVFWNSVGKRLSIDLVSLAKCKR